MSAADSNADDLNAAERQLLQRLEHATSRTPVDLSQLDEETVAMREQWLALERLLRASDQLDRPVPVSFSARQTASRWRRAWFGLAALAAAVLLAVGLLWPQPKADVVQGIVPRTVAPGVAPDHPVRPAPQSATTENAYSGRSAELAWEDDWEQAVQETAVAMRELRETRESADAALTRLTRQFSELASEFESGAL